MVTNKKMSARDLLANDLKGLSQLAENGMDGVLDLVEAMHQNVLSLGGLLDFRKAKDKPAKSSGLTGFIYKTVRKTSALSFKGVNLALATFNPLVPNVASQLWQGRARNQWLAILNGVLGDHLAETDNPLKAEMQLIHAGQVIDSTQAAALMESHGGESLLLVHGLCMNDEQWLHKGHEHGVALSESHQLQCFYLRYNTGLAIHQNGQELSELLESISHKRKKASQLNLLCHSMGGLVARSAVNHSVLSENHWHKQLNKAVFLGTPHQGATLEKTGQVMDYLLSISAYSVPFAKLTRSRSQGIKDLQHGRICVNCPVEPLPNHIEFHAVAASRPTFKEKKQGIVVTSTFKQAGAGSINSKGDGLVSVNSALGRNKKSGKQIDFNAKQQWIITNCDHMQLLGVKASDLLVQIWDD